MSTTVYFIQAGDHGPIKIGYSSDPFRRLANLQSGHYEPLTLLGFCSGGAETEARLHADLAPYCMNGEWFLPSPEVLDVIEIQAAPLLAAADVFAALTPFVAAAVTGLRSGDLAAAEAAVAAIGVAVEVAADSLGFRYEGSGVEQTITARITEMIEQRVAAIEPALGNAEAAA